MDISAMLTPSRNNLKKNDEITDNNQKSGRICRVTNSICFKSKNYIVIKIAFLIDYKSINLINYEKYIFMDYCNGYIFVFIL